MVKMRYRKQKTTQKLSCRFRSVNFNIVDTSHRNRSNTKKLDKIIAKVELT